MRGEAEAFVIYARGSRRPCTFLNCRLSVCPVAPGLSVFERSV